jgi:hypothetical protein
MKLWMQLLAVLAALAPTLCAQAMAETALGVGRAATTTAPAGKAAGKAIGAAMGNIGKSLDKTADTKEKPKPRPTAKRTGAAATHAAKAEPKFGPKPAFVYEDPAGINTGMEYAEVIRRFGAPSMSINNGAAQTLWYDNRDHPIEVQVQGGKVFSVRNTARPDSHSVVAK